MPHVAGAGRPLDATHVGDPEEGGYPSQQLVERRAFAHSDVVHPVHRSRIVCKGGAEVRLHGVRDIAEIARRLAVTIDLHRLAEEGGTHPARDYRGVGALRILARPEDVEI